MIALVISPKMREKLETKHKVQEREIEECFLEHDGKYLIDNREQHNSDPPTLWFIGRTYRGRQLKVIFIAKDGKIYIRSAYEPNDTAIRIYTELTKNKE